MRRLLLLLPALFAAGTAGAADAPQHVGAFESWNVFATGAGAKKVCYVASHPAETHGGPAKRGDVMLLITHYPADKAFDEVAVRPGFAAKDGVDLEALVGGTTFKLFFRDGAGWNRDAGGDKAMVQSMKAGVSLVVKTIPAAGGKLAEDTWSLKGFTAAHDALDKACGAK